MVFIIQNVLSMQFRADIKSKQWWWFCPFWYFAPHYEVVMLLTYLLLGFTRPLGLYSIIARDTGYIGI
jgi:hypothetical protein